jgi:hypothetical protein
MNQSLFEKQVQCPYCWEQFTILIDGSEASQEYVEDCYVCCRPINFIVNIDDEDGVDIQARSDND